MIPRIYNHSYTISADLVVPEGGAEGVIVAAFDHLGGFALYVQDGKLKHHYSMLGRARVHARRPRRRCRPARSTSRWSSRPTRRSRRPAAR